MATKTIPKTSDRKPEQQAHKVLQRILDSGDEEAILAANAMLSLIALRVKGEGGAA